MLDCLILLMHSARLRLHCESESPSLPGGAMFGSERFVVRTAEDAMARARVGSGAAFDAAGSPA